MERNLETVRIDYASGSFAVKGSRKMFVAIGVIHSKEKSW